MTLETLTMHVGEVTENSRAEENPAEPIFKD